MPKPRLSDNEVREIRRLYHQEEKTLVVIGGLFGRSFQTIHKIVHRRTYQHVPAVDYHMPRNCHNCLDCVADRRRERNVAIGNAARLVGECVRCGEPVKVKATKLIGAPGRVLCAKHDRRLRPDQFEEAEIGRP